MSETGPSTERCVFHARTSQNAQARELIPLSALRERDPGAYARAIAKYDGTPERRSLPGTRIPHMDVTWIDVVFLTPIRPHAIWQAWLEETGTALATQEFWAIPIHDVPDPYLFDRSLSSTGDPIDEREVSRVLAEQYTSSPITTAGNRAWLHDLAGSGRRGAWFHRTPHVLSRGPVPLTRAHIVSWDDD